MKIMFWSLAQRVELFIRGKQWKTTSELKEQYQDMDPLRRIYFEKQLKDERTNALVVGAAVVAALLISGVIYIVR